MRKPSTATAAAVAPFPRVSAIVLAAFVTSLVVLAVSLVALAIASVAGATEVVERFTVSDAPGVQSRADVCGDIVVYQKNGASNGWNILGYDRATATTFPICAHPGDQVHPRIDGTTVVWEDHRAGNADIYGYDLVTETEFVICADPREQRRPVVSGAWIVWQDHRGESWDIYGWDLGDAPGGAPVCAAGKDQTDPDVDGDWVVWTDRRWGDRDILGYNRVADYEFRACVDFSDQDQPAVDGDTVVWRDARGLATLGTDIFAFDLTTSTERVVWSGPGQQSDPAVSGDLVLWTDGLTATSAAGVNVVGLDLAFDQVIWLARGNGWQGQPAVDGYTAAWGDTHSSPAADLKGATLTPWSTNLRVTTTSGKHEVDARVRGAAAPHGAQQGRHRHRHAHRGHGRSRCLGAVRHHHHALSLGWRRRQGVHGAVQGPLPGHVALGDGFDRARHPRSLVQRPVGRVGRPGRHGDDQVSRQRQPLAAGGRDDAHQELGRSDGRDHADRRQGDRPAPRARLPLQPWLRGATGSSSRPSTSPATSRRSSVRTSSSSPSRAAAGRRGAAGSAGAGPRVALSAALVATIGARLVCRDGPGGARDDGP